MQTKLTNTQIQQIKKIIGPHNGHTQYNNTNWFFIFGDDNIYSIFSQIQDLGLQVIIGWTYYKNDKNDYPMIQIGVIPQQITI